MDMKEKMLLPVRRLAGLEDNFFYNNCPESMNGYMKKEIDHQKKSASPANPQSVLMQSFLTFQKSSWESTAEMFTGPLLETRRISWHLLTVIWMSPRKNLSLIHI